MIEKNFKTAIFLQDGDVARPEKKGQKTWRDCTDSRVRPNYILFI